MKKIALLLIYLFCVVAAASAQVDTDGDGIINRLDLDDDNDGIEDINENTCRLPGFEKFLPANLFWDLNNNAFPGALENNAFGSAINASVSQISFGTGFNLVSKDLIIPQWLFNGATATSSAQALAKNEYLQVTLSMATNTSNPIYELTDWTTWINHPSYMAQNLTIAISTDASFNNASILYDGVTPDGETGFLTTPLNKPFRLSRGVRYFIRVYFYGPVASFTFDSMGFNGVCYTDTDGDGIPNTEDTDSDNDGCSDSNEYYNNSATSGNDGRYGPQAGRTVDATGKVIGASYSSTFYSNVITVSRPANINSAPTDKLIDAGSNTSYTANASTTAGTLNYQWQVSTDNKINWTNVTNGMRYSGSTTSTLNVNAAPKTMNGYFYRLLIRNNNNVCADVYTTPAILDIKPVAQNDLDCYTPGVSRIITLLNNDNTGDNPVATTVVIISAAATNAGKKLVVNNEGTWQVAADGKITFSPASNFTGQPSVISYKFKDAEGNDSNQATLTLNPTQSPQVQLTGSLPKQF